MTDRTFCMYMIALSKERLTPRVEFVCPYDYRALFSNFFYLVLDSD